MDAPLPPPDLRPEANLVEASSSRAEPATGGALPTGGGPSGGPSVELGVLILALLAAVLVWVRLKLGAGASAAAASDRPRARGARPRPVDAWAESARRLRVPPEGSAGGHDSRGGL